MEIIKVRDQSSLIICLAGKLDTITSPQLEEFLEEELEGIVSLTFDFEKLEYISSSGLRVLLCAQKIMNRQGCMAVKNVSGDVEEVFSLTGFDHVLNIT